MIQVEGRGTLVDEFEFADDVETDFGVVVFEHLEEHWEEMFDGCVFAEDGGEATEVFTKGSPDLRIRVANEFLDRHENVVQYNRRRNQLAES
jgi:hypothetical protein